MIELSIIIPVYNVEKYIYKCINSIFCQGLSDDCYEIIIIDDGSKDKSIDIVRSFAIQHNNIKILSQKNQGQSVARNNGLAHAVGSLIMFVDSDDFLVEHSLNKLLNIALNYNVDILIADFLKVYDENINNIGDFSIDEPCTPVLLNRKQAFIEYLSPNQCFIWRTIYRKAFLEKNNLCFLPGVFFEDILFTVECYLKIEKALFFPFTFYIYRQHSNSTVSTLSKKKLIDINTIIAYLLKLNKNNKLSEDEDNKLQDIVFSTFSLEMWYLIHENGLFAYKKEVVEDLKMKVSRLRFNKGIEQRLTSFLFNRNPYIYLWVRRVLKR